MSGKNELAISYSTALAIVIVVVGIFVFTYKSVYSKVFGAIFILFGISWFIVSIIAPTSLFGDQSSVQVTKCTNDTKTLTQLQNNCNCLPIEKKMPTNQDFQIMGNNDSCLNDSPRYEPCNTSDYSQYYHINDDGLIVNSNNGKCLFNEENSLIFKNCNPYDARQKISINNNGSVTNGNSCLSNSTPYFFDCPQPSNSNFNNYQLGVPFL